MIYILSEKGSPLMPTENNGKVRKLLKQNKAKIVDYKPFTIQLLYETEEHTQATVLGIDTGRENISITVVQKEDGNVLFSSELVTRNKNIPKLMEKRKTNRQARRRNRRQKKVRLAKSNNTFYKRAKHIRENGTSLSILVKHIAKKDARFSNRVRPKGWLTPTANNLLLTHLNYVNKVKKILPITEVVVEYAKFDIHKLKDSTISGEEYQQGDLYGYLNMKAFITARQEGKCLLCNKDYIEQLHHIIRQSEGGSDHHSNLAGLCRSCHNKVHKSPTFDKKVTSLMKGMKKEFNATSILNIIMPYLYMEIQAIFGESNVFKTHGYITKTDRMTHKLDKSHYNDSYLVALTRANNFIIESNLEPYYYTQFRRHNRQFLDALRERTYKDGKVTVAKNKHKRTEQLEPSLEEYRKELMLTYSKKETDRIISDLKVVPGIKRYKTPIKEIPIPYGSVVLYKGERHIVSGILNKGKTLRLVGKPKENIGLKSVRLLQRNMGMVCL